MKTYGKIEGKNNNIKKKDLELLKKANNDNIKTNKQGKPY